MLAKCDTYPVETYIPPKIKACDWFKLKNNLHTSMYMYACTVHALCCFAFHTLTGQFRPTQCMVHSQVHRKCIVETRLLKNRLNLAGQFTPMVHSQIHRKCIVETHLLKNRHNLAGQFTPMVHSQIHRKCIVETCLLY